MPRDINEGIEHADPCYGGKQKEQEMLFDDFCFSSKIFPGEWKNNNSSTQPAIKSKGNGRNIINNASCDNKISRQDKRGKNCQANSNKNLALMMVVIHC